MDLKKVVTQLESLKLHRIAELLPSCINKFENGESNFDELFTYLINEQYELKQHNAIHAMVKVGGFPHFKTLDDFDFTFQESISKTQITSLANLEFLEKNENILFLGSSGVGKTHLATSIGIECARSRISTYFIKCSDLLIQLKKAKLENRLEHRLKNFTRHKLLIIDEVGYLPIDSEDAKLLFQLIDMRYEKKSTIITSNYMFTDWEKIFIDKTLASAIIDRLVHHSTVVTIKGKSYRTFEHIEKQASQNK